MAIIFNFRILVVCRLICNDQYSIGHEENIVVSPSLIPEMNTSGDVSDEIMLLVASQAFEINDDKLEEQVMIASQITRIIRRTRK